MPERGRALEAPHEKEEGTGYESYCLQGSMDPRTVYVPAKVNISAGSCNHFIVLAPLVPSMIGSGGPSGDHVWLPAGNLWLMPFYLLRCHRRLSVEEEPLTFPSSTLPSVTAHSLPLRVLAHVYRHLPLNLLSIQPRSLP